MRSGKAIYIGTQQGIDDMPSFNLYNIVLPGHPLHGSTVDIHTVEKLGLEIVEATYYQTMNGNDNKAFEIIEEEAGL